MLLISLLPTAYRIREFFTKLLTSKISAFILLYKKYRLKADNMRFLVRTGVIEKLYRTLAEYSAPTTSSSLRKKRDAHIENLLQTRIRHFLEHMDTRGSITETLDSPKYVPRTISGVDSKLREKESLRYNELLAAIEALLVTERASERTKSIRRIDDECCALLPQLSKSEILHVLHRLMRSGRNIATLKLYRSSLLALSKDLEKGRLCVGEKLQLLFFEGLGKKAAKRNVLRLLNHLPPLRDLRLMEKAVVAHSAFKCSVKLKAEDARSLEETLEKDAAEIVKDPGILVTICKAVSCAGTSDNFCLDNLSRAVVERDESWTLLQAAHLLGMYVEANSENSALTERLFRDAVAQIAMERRGWRSNVVRIKDVDRLVWASGMLNYRLSRADEEELSLFVHRRYAEFATKPFLLVNSLLALWILDCRLYDVIDDCVANGLFLRVRKQDEMWKPAARLHLLLSCVKIESPETKLPRELFHTDKVGMKVPRSVKTLYRIIDESRGKLGIGEAGIDCPVDGIYIAGVSLKNEGKLIHVDLLDERTCFRGTNVPHGLMKLKLRLLDKIGYYPVAIPEQHSSDAEFVCSTILKSIKESTE